MSEKYLICTDLDRTLLPNGRQRESENARDIFSTIVSRHDVDLAFVTGRDKQLVEQAISEYQLPIPDYVIGDVGTSIYEVGSNTWQKNIHWHENIASDWQGYSNTELSEMLNGINELELQEQEKQNEFKLSYYTDVSADTEELSALIRNQLALKKVETNLIWSIDDLENRGLLDVIPAKASKLHAIEFLVQDKRYSFSNTIFSGDSGNDLPVMTSHIQSVLVANASEEVKKQATSMANAAGLANKLYIATGRLPGLNGNYAAGIIEGLVHYIPEAASWLNITDG